MKDRLKRLLIFILATVYTLRDNIIICTVHRIRLSRYSIAVLEYILRTMRPRADNYCIYNNNNGDQDASATRHIGEKYITPEVELSQVVQRLRQWPPVTLPPRRGTY